MMLKALNIVQRFSPASLMEPRRPDAAETGGLPVHHLRAPDHEYSSNALRPSPQFTCGQIIQMHCAIDRRQPDAEFPRICSAA